MYRGSSVGIPTSKNVVLYPGRTTGWCSIVGRVTKLDEMFPYFKESEGHDLATLSSEPVRDVKIHFSVEADFSFENRWNIC